MGKTSFAVMVAPGAGAMKETVCAWVIPIDMRPTKAEAAVKRIVK